MHRKRQAGAQLVDRAATGVGEERLKRRARVLLAQVARRERALLVPTAPSHVSAPTPRAGHLQRAAFSELSVPALSRSSGWRCYALTGRVTIRLATQRVSALPMREENEMCVRRPILASVATVIVALVLASTSLAAAPASNPPEGAVTTPMELIPIANVATSASGPATVTLVNGTALTIPNTEAVRLRAARLEAGFPEVLPSSSTPAATTAVPTALARMARVRRTPHRGAHAANTVYGDCGYSWIYEEPNSNHSGAIVKTGWAVYHADVFSFGWFFAGENYTYHRSFYGEYGGEYSGSTWNNPFYQALKGKGGYNGAVSVFQSYVIAAEGVCYSGGPATGTTV